MNTIIKSILCFAVLTSIIQDCYCKNYPPNTESSIGPIDCNCQKMMKDGATVLQCQILPIANDNTTQIGLGAGKANNNLSVSLTIRFIDKAMEIDRSYEFSLWLDDGNVVDLKYLNGGLAYMGNSQVAQGIYVISPEQVLKLKASRIKTVAFKLTDGLRRSYQVKLNSDIFVRQLNCLFASD